jgi:hypothetical protein
MGDRTGMPARADRLSRLAGMMIGWIDEDWDMPHVHEMRKAVGMTEVQQGVAAAVMRADLVAFREHMDLMVGKPV